MRLQRLESEVQSTGENLVAPDTREGSIDAIGIADVSFLPRYGVKGPGAEAALCALGLTLPAEPNQWRGLDGGGRIIRLGRSEFLTEDDISGSSVPRVRAALADGAPGVYPVPRNDLALVLVGKRVPELWAQICSFDLREFERRPGLVVATTMIGVSVTVLRARCAGRDGLRIWCDATFGAYFHSTLLDIARELEGGAAAVGEVLPHARSLYAI